MIDIVKAKNYFKEYVSNYDTSDSRVKLKIVHINHVSENAKQIAKFLNLSQEEQNLAELIGLLHDLGRFEQLRIYGTFSDKNSINHAEKAVEILFKNNLIRKFAVDEKYDNIIYKAIKNHNTIKIEEGLSKQELLHSKIIRDADKLDIYRVLLENKLEDCVHIKTNDVSKEIISTEYFNNFSKQELLLYENIKSNIDFLVVIISYIYDLNFIETLKLIKDKDYIRKVIEKIDAKDEYTREKLNEINTMAMDYINKKINN